MPLELPKRAAPAVIGCGVGDGFVHPDDGLSRSRSDLDEVAELVDHPQLATMRLVLAGVLAPNQGLAPRPPSVNSQMMFRCSIQRRRMPGTPPCNTLLVAIS
jgi:hypothetical protein